MESLGAPVRPTLRRIGIPYLIDSPVSFRRLGCCWRRMSRAIPANYAVIYIRTAIQEPPFESFLQTKYHSQN
jgi:hypothetical protein